MKLYKIKKSDIDKKGKGLYATRDIKEGEKIIDYKGKLITKKQTEQSDKYDNSKPIYLFTVNKRYDLDGDYPWNTAGLINHSCINNCDYDGKGLKIWVKAIKDIKKGEELTCDYGFGYDKDYKQFPCKCKSKNCCGYIVRAESRWRINKKFSMGNRKNQYKTFCKNNPSAGAGGAHKFLFFDLITFVNFFTVHFFSPTYFKQPTIDLTCCFKND